MKIVIMVIMIITFSSTSVFADTNSLSSVDWINTVLFAVGLVLLGWYQKYQIGLLKKELESQKNIISSLKQYSDIVDINKIKEFVDISESTVEKRKEIELKELHLKFDQQIKSIETEKKKLLDKINTSTSETDKLKSDYKELVVISSQRVSFFYQYICLTQLLQMISLGKDRVIMYVRALLKKNEIESDILIKTDTELTKLSEKIYDAMLPYQQLDISKVDKKIEFPDKVSKIAIESSQFLKELRGITDIVTTEFDEIYKEIIHITKNF